MRALEHDEIVSLTRLLISNGITVTSKASTVSMVTDTKGKMGVVRVSGWLSVKEITPEVQVVLDSFEKSLV